MTLPQLDGPIDVVSPEHSSDDRSHEFQIASQKNASIEFSKAEYARSHQSRIRTLHHFSSFFFFLWYGRSRSKARSLHEKKLLLRKLLHGHRWSHAALANQIKTKTQTTKNKRQDADPPARFASHHPKDSKANSERGKSPTETTTKDLPRTQW